MRRLRLNLVLIHWSLLMSLGDWWGDWWGYGGSHWRPLLNHQLELLLHTPTDLGGNVLRLNIHHLFDSWRGLSLLWSGLASLRRLLFLALCPSPLSLSHFSSQLGLQGLLRLLVASPSRLEGLVVLPENDQVFFGPCQIAL
jgi:hypothetical protein